MLGALGEAGHASGTGADDRDEVTLEYKLYDPRGHRVSLAGIVDYLRAAAVQKIPGEDVAMLLFRTGAGVPRE